MLIENQINQEVKSTMLTHNIYIYTYLIYKNLRPNRRLFPPAPLAVTTEKCLSIE